MHPLMQVEQGTLSLTSASTEAFITKFSFDIGNKANIEMKFTGHAARYLDDHPHTLQLSVFNDEAWERYLAAQKAGSLCKDRMSGATGKFLINKSTGERAALKATSKIEDGKFEFTVKESYELNERSHYFFFVLSDCSLEWYDAHPPTLDFWLHITNGDRELPAFERGLLLTHGILGLALLAACAVAAKGLAAQHKRYGQVHLSAAAAAGATLLQTSACLLEFVHLWAYSADGMGYRCVRWIVAGGWDAREA